MIAEYITDTFFILILLIAIIRKKIPDLMYLILLVPIYCFFKVLNNSNIIQAMKVIEFMTMVVGVLPFLLLYSEKNKKKGLIKSPFSAILNVSKERGIKKMKFTEEQIKAILECIGNTNIELFRSEWEEIEESLRKGN